MLDVIDVIGDTLSQLLNIFRGAARPMDLRPSCYARFHPIALCISGNNPLASCIDSMQMVGMWSGADQRHVATKNIPKLWQFIKARATQEPTNARASRVIANSLTSPS